MLRSSIAAALVLAVLSTAASASPEEVCIPKGGVAPECARDMNPFSGAVSITVTMHRVRTPTGRRHHLRNEIR